MAVTVREMHRRAFLRLSAGGVVAGAAALLGGCGGGGGDQRRTLRGVVLEDEGAGAVRSAGAGISVFAVTFDRFGVARRQVSTAETDSTGRFQIDVPHSGSYGFVTKTYYKNLTLANGVPPSITQPRCAVVPSADVNSGGVAEFGSIYGPGSLSYLSGEWVSRSRMLAREYGVDLVILANLPCVSSDGSDAYRF